LMKGSLAFSAKSRTVRARSFLNCSSNMIKPQTPLTERLDASSKQRLPKQLKGSGEQPVGQSEAATWGGVARPPVPGPRNRPLSGAYSCDANQHPVLLSNVRPG
jgi:hypothetical protein